MKDVYFGPNCAPDRDNSLLLPVIAYLRVSSIIIRSVVKRGFNCLRRRRPLISCAGIWRLEFGGSCEARVVMDGQKG